MRNGTFSALTSCTLTILLQWSAADAATEYYEVPLIVDPDWYDYGYAPGKLSMPPTGNGRILDWHERWPGHPDMYLTPASCTENLQSLEINCSETSCRGGFRCRRDSYCPEDSELVDGKCLRMVDKDCKGGGVGNPCDPANGNKYQVETDFQIDSLAVVRTYNSTNARDHGFGVGWTMPFGKRLHIAAETIGIERDTGRTEGWTIDSGQVVGDPDSRYNLELLENGARLIHRDGSIEHYDANGRLVAEWSANGRETRYSYDSEGMLESVTGPFGRSIAIAWDENGYVGTIVDPLGGEYHYLYDESDNLVSVTNPDQTTREYHYENSSFPNHLTGITDERGVRFATFGYDDQGRAVFTQHAGGDAPTSPPTERYEISYGQ